MKKVASITAMARFLLFFGFLFFSPLNLMAQDQIDMDQVYAEEEFRFGVRAFHDGAYNKATLAFEKSLSLKPDYILAEKWLALTYFQNGFTSTALDMWDRLLEQEDLGAAMNTMLATLKYRRTLSEEESAAPNYVEFFSLEGVRDDSVLFKRPTSVTPSEDGGFYVVSFAGNEVLKFSANGNLLSTIRGGIEGLNHPFDLSINPEEGLFITEFSGDRIVHCSHEGRVLNRFGGTGTGEGELLGPQFITDDGKGYLYVTDQGNSRVSKFDYEGNFILSFGGVTGVFKGLQEPTGIIAYKDLIFVADKELGSLIVYDESGNYVNSIESRFLENPEGLSLYGEGELLVADRIGVLLFETETETFMPIVNPDGSSYRIMNAARDANDNLLMVDFNRSKVSLQADFSRMYSGMFVKINQVSAADFPKVYVDITVQRREGAPFVGLESENFYLTEGRYAVEDMEFEGAVDTTDFAEVSLLVEKSSSMRERAEGIGQAALLLGQELLPSGRVNVIGAEQQPTMQLEEGGDPQQIRAAALAGTYRSDWQFDQGLRLAVSPLLDGGIRRAVVFLHSGELPDTAFSSYELIHLADYLRHNNVAFYAVSTDPEGRTATEIEYLCEQTGGEYMYLYQPEGLAPMVKHLRRLPTGRYILSYRSGRDSNFGRNYLPIEVQASIFGRSGRAETGYFAPPE